MKLIRPIQAFFAALSVGLVVGCGAPDHTEPLRVACDFSNPPFASWPEGADAEGFDVELARELATRMGRELDHRRVSFERLIDAVEAGRVDLAIATIGRTEERAERVRFSRPYFTTSILALVRAGEGEQRAVSDLIGRRLAASQGTTSELALRERGLLDEWVAPTGKDGPVVERLLSREVDAAVMDGPDAWDFAAERPGELAVVGEALAREDYCVAIRPDDPHLESTVDRVLEELESEGWLIERAERFGLRP